jgi:hypothetical protein
MDAPAMSRGSLGSYSSCRCWVGGGEGLQRVFSMNFGQDMHRLLSLSSLQTIPAKQGTVAPLKFCRERCMRWRWMLTCMGTQGMARPTFLRANQKRTNKEVQGMEWSWLFIRERKVSVTCNCNLHGRLHSLAPTCWTRKITNLPWRLIKSLCW